MGERRTESIRGLVTLGAALSFALHVGLVALLLRRQPAPAPVDAPVEIAVLEPPPKPAPPVWHEPPAPSGRPGGEAPLRPRVPPSSPRETNQPARTASAEPIVPDAPSGEAETTADDHSLLRMRRSGVNLAPSDETLARALAPVEVPAPTPTTKPARKPRLPGTGLTMLEPPPEEKVRLIHPRYYEVLAGAEHNFRVDHQRLVDEVRGELARDKTVKRWLFGSMGGDPDAMKNQVPTLACLVCVTLRPSQRPVIELAGASGSDWFDVAAKSSIERAVGSGPEDAQVEAARACYRFAAKTWRTRPDLSNLAIPFKLNFSSSIRLLTYAKLGS